MNSECQVMSKLAIWAGEQEGNRTTIVWHNDEGFAFVEGDGDLAIGTLSSMSEPHVHVLSVAVWQPLLPLLIECARRMSEGAE